uniref:UNC80 domain-containing protein n=1 Tax=Soboliphyme baturini TaxID=241478 RepID=A0A183IYH1_9BILA
LRGFRNRYCAELTYANLVLDCCSKLRPVESFRHRINGVEFICPVCCLPDVFVFVVSEVYELVVGLSSSYTELWSQVDYIIPCDMANPPSLSGVKRRIETNDGGCIPLPVQSFLWRQTNPFLSPKVGKLHEASCLTFERVVVQNILHGLSPSLSEAISSIKRWRFVQTAFPHIVQCCAALLSDLPVADEHRKLSPSLVKMLYILHWMVLDSAVECADSDAAGKDEKDVEEVLNQHLFPLYCIQIFVYMICPLAFKVTEQDISDNIRLEGGLPLWQALWDFRQPEILCFVAPVKAKVSQLLCLPLLKKNLQPTLASKNIYLGGTESSAISGVTSGATTAVDSEPLKRPKKQDIPLKNDALKMLKDVRTTAGKLLSPKVIQKISGDNEAPRPTRDMRFMEDEPPGGIISISDRAPLVQLKEICGASFSSTESTSIHSVLNYVSSAINGYSNTAFVASSQCNERKPLFSGTEGTELILVFRYSVCNT